MASAQNKSHWLVIGVGNDYRNDDAVGLVVARRIRELSIAGLTVIEASGEATNLIAAWQDASQVILIDAVCSGAEPGTIHRFDVHAQVLPASLFHSSTHAFGVAEAVELARELNRLPARLIVYGIEGKDFSAGTTLSQAVEQAANRAVERVIQFDG
jgi:hydrogenase maturation protease